MAKRVSTNRIKSNRTYNVAELARLAKVTEQTVRRWFKEGLKPLDHSRPTLILGAAALYFLGARKQKASRKLDPDQFLCMTCKTRRQPLGMMVDYEPLNAMSGRLVALCSVCEGQCIRGTSLAKLSDHEGIFEVLIKPMKRH